VYELVDSLYQYVNIKEHQSFRLDKQRRKSVQQQLTPAFAAELEDERLEVLHRINLLVWQCPGDRTPVSFLKWLQEQPPGELYERLAPWVELLPGNLHEIRDRMVYL
ncbi:hypothetical protein MXD63_42755, partial [Frankia sp. Cpl3]|nr:hypothetical protein [Frankia sp. Cpl3]